MKERTHAVSLVNYNAREGLLGLFGYFVLFFPTKSSILQSEKW